MGDLEKQELKSLKGDEEEEEKEEEEEEEEEEEGMDVLDFDMLCSTVAMQTRQGKWGKLRTHEEDLDLELELGGGGKGEIGGIFRMWEGEVLDCLDDRRIAFQSACCPCYRFGKNMKRAGFGPCFLQGTVHCGLVLAALLSFIAFFITMRHWFLYLAIAFSLSIGIYMGFFRTQMRKKFKIRVSDSPLDDCIFHLVCPCCSLCQESRTLEINNVQDGTWHGRGDTLCIGGYGEGNKTFIQLHPPPVVLTESPGSSSLQKSTDIADQC